MRTVRVAFFSLAFLVILSLPLNAAEAIDPDLLAVREAAWRAWFGGDEAALRSMLPEDFLSIGWDGNEISDRDKAIGSSREFKKAGGLLVSLSFPETRAQRIGDTVVLYGSYEVTFAIGAKEQQVRGLLTEVFVKRDGRWLHPGWHVDSR
ncbi:MAG TPA: nuclear transport factor 2 family protein [Thermoanaerobaculia bacterium]|nr:nuclear transport factor 2 family protein [Thermoanaerobaculia bacterium]